MSPAIGILDERDGQLLPFGRRGGPRKSCIVLTCSGRANLPPSIFDRSIAMQGEGYGDQN